MSVEEVAAQLANINSPDDELREAATSYFDQFLKNDQQQLLFNLTIIAKTDFDESKAVPIIQAHILIHKILSPNSEKIFKFVQDFWDSLPDEGKDDIFELCKAGITGEIVPVANFASDILVDVFRLVPDLCDKFNDVFTGFGNTIDESQNPEVIRQRLIDTIIKFCEVEKPLKIEWIGPMVDTAKTVINEASIDEKFRYFKLLDAIYNKDFEEFNSIPVISEFIEIMNQFIANAPVDEEIGQQIIQQIFESLSKLFIRTYGKNYFGSDPIKDFLKNGFTCESEMIKSEALKTWAHLAKTEFSWKEECRKNETYSNSVEKYFSDSPNLIRKYHYPLKTHEYNGYFYNILHEEGFMETVFDMIKIINDEERNIQDFDEDDMPVRIRVASLFEVLVKLDTEFIFDKIEEQLARERTDDWREDYTDCLILLAICKLRHPRTNILLRQKLSWIIQVVLENPIPILKEIGLVILSCAIPTIFSDLSSDGYEPETPKEERGIIYEKFVDILQRLASNNSDSPPLLILTSKFAINYIIWHRIRVINLSRLEDMIDVIPAFCKQLMESDGSLENGLFSAAYTLEEVFIKNLDRFAANAKTENYILETIKSNLAIYKAMLVPNEITETERVTRKDYAINHARSVVSNHTIMMFQYVEELLPFCFNLLDEIGSLEPNIIDIIVTLTGTIMRKNLENHYEKLCQLRDRSIESGIPDVVKVGYKLLGAIFQKYTQIEKDNIDNYIEKIVDVFEPDKFQASAYVSTLDILTNMLNTYANFSTANVTEQNAITQQENERKQQLFNSGMEMKYKVRNMIIEKFGIQKYNEFYKWRRHADEIMKVIDKATCIFEDATKLRSKYKNDKNVLTKIVETEEHLSDEVPIEFSDRPDLKSVISTESTFVLTDKIQEMLFKIYTYLNELDYSNNAYENAEFLSQIIAAVYRHFATIIKMFGTESFIKEFKAQVFCFINHAVENDLLTNEVLKEFTNFMHDVCQKLPIRKFAYFSRANIIDTLFISMLFLPTKESNEAEQLLDQFCCRTMIAK